jgi:sodium-dependent dicarboxylate transporter 2/3/5
VDNTLILTAGLITLATLVFWLTEWVPLYATTMGLMVAIAVFLGGSNADFGLAQVLSWAANPILVLFFGGFALSVAAQKYQLDQFICAALMRFSGNSQNKLVLNILLGTAFLSMWISNIAAAAMMLVALKPTLHQDHPRLRKSLLLAVALGANLGGMATPIGTGPNGIAIAILAQTHSVSFAEWMSFAVPLTVGLLALAYGLLRVIYRFKGQLPIKKIPVTALSKAAWKLLALFGATILLWLLEPWHGVSAAVIAAASAFVLFASRLLNKDDLNKIDWGTLFLIAGGITLGTLIERSGLAQWVNVLIPWDQLSKTAVSFVLIFSCALLSALASNTAAAALMIELGRQIDPSPTLTILIALGASLGIPFVISTPPNAMVYGQGGLKLRDFLIPGLLIMLLGSLALTFTGEFFLKIFLG